MNHFKYIVYIVLIQCLFALPLGAQIHSWVDEDGVRRYSDTRPEKPDGAFEVIEEIENKGPDKQN